VEFQFGRGIYSYQVRNCKSPKDGNLTPTEVSLQKANSRTGPGSRSSFQQQEDAADAADDAATDSTAQKHQPLWQMRVHWSILDSFLSSQFGFLDWPKVRVVDHIVLAGLCGRNIFAGRKHGVLFVSSRIILSEAKKKQETSEKSLLNTPLISLEEIV